MGSQSPGKREAEGPIRLKQGDGQGHRPPDPHGTSRHWERRQTLSWASEAEPWPCPDNWRVVLLIPAGSLRRSTHLGVESQAQPTMGSAVTFLTWT